MTSSMQKFLRRAILLQLSHNALSHDVESMIAKLEIDVYNKLKWFHLYFMLTNPTRFQVMFLVLKKNQNLLLEKNFETIATSK